MTFSDIGGHDNLFQSSPALSDGRYMDNAAVSDLLDKFQSSPALSDGRYCITKNAPNNGGLKLPLREPSSQRKRIKHSRIP